MSEFEDSYLTGRLLIAMPTMLDPRFARTVIYMCAHNDEGAMGLVINRLIGSITRPGVWVFHDHTLLLGIDRSQVSDRIRVHFGGPVESGRGFVLHSGDYTQDGTLQVSSDLALTATVEFPDLLEQLGIDRSQVSDRIRVHFGGPVESGRGFVLHSGDYTQDGTLQVSSDLALTATVDILRDIADGGGPRLSMLALGYAGWGAGQLDAEIQANGWLHGDPDEALVFDDDLDGKWERAIGKLGIDISMLSGDAGHA